MSSVEPVEDVSAQTAQPAQPGNVRPERAARRRLSPEQQHEVARLYAESTTPTAEIRKRFGIGESSRYRIVQREGVPLRGRAAPTPQPAPLRTPAADSRRGRPATPNGAGTSGAAARRASSSSIS